MKYGLLGRKLSHSYSPAIHRLFGNADYGLFEVEPEALGNFLRRKDFFGLNVTMPYKQAVIPFLDELSPIAQRLGAVNTIVNRNGRLVGHNTDYFGFRQMLNVNVAGKKALILGSGGAAKTASAVLEDQGAKVVIISRAGENNYSNLNLHSDAAILVNATPVGMYPHTGVSPVELDRFAKLEAVLDVIYNPTRTKLLLDAESLGIPCKNGLEMLVYQAAESDQWFRLHSLSEFEIRNVFRILRAQMENWILIGMPGCGKTSIGKMLAERLGKPFVDLDAEIQKEAKKSPAALISEDGEEVFRTWETIIADRFCKESGLVIATGGGIVTRQHNYPLLHQNGRIVYLCRSLDSLATDDRPLSQNLEELFRTRQSLYTSFADYTVENCDSLESTVSKILTFREEIL